MIWTNEYLDRLRIEGEEEISRQLKCIIDRISFPVSIGQSEFLMPDYVIDIRKVYWKGFRLEPVSDMALSELGYDLRTWADGSFNGEAFSSAFDIGSYTTENTFGSGIIEGVPTRYMYYGFGENVIRLNPSPNEALNSSEDDLWSNSIIRNALIVEFYRVADGNSWRLPHYFRRRTLKAYVMWKAFSKEGTGQNLKAAQFHQQKFAGLMQRAKIMVDNVYRAAHKVAPSTVVAASTYTFVSPCENEYGYQGPRRIPRPVLPSNYGIVLEDE